MKQKKYILTNIIFLGIGFILGMCTRDQKEIIITRTNTVIERDTVALDSVIQFIDSDSRSVYQALPTPKKDTIIIVKNDTIQLLKSIDNKNIDSIRIYNDSLVMEAVKIKYSLGVHGRLLFFNPKITLTNRKTKVITKFKTYKWGVTGHGGAYIYDHDASFTYGASINYKNYYFTTLRHRGQGFTVLLGYQIRF